MPLLAQDIDALARLARLEIADDDRDTFVRQLGDIVRHLDALASVDVDGIAPWQPATPAMTPLRVDAVGPSLPVDDALREAPASADGLVIVPRFVDT